MIIVLACTVGLNVWLFSIIPKGFFPEQDTGRLSGFIQADQSISFQRMSQKLQPVHGHRPERPGRGRTSSASPARAGAAATPAPSSSR